MNTPKDLQYLQELCNDLQRENTGLRARVEFLEGGIKELRSIVTAVSERVMALPAARTRPTKHGMKGVA